MIGARRFFEDGRQISRRSLLALLESRRFIFPNATYEQPSAFKAGPAADYPVGSTTVFIDQPVVINRDSNGIYAFNLICTHLGCTPRFFPDVTSDLVAIGIAGIRDPLTGQAATRTNPTLPGFKCPCHGSRYFRDSVNFYGPAPRPMDHIAVALAPDGRLLVGRTSFVDILTRLKV